MRKGKLFEGNMIILEHFQEAVLDDGRKVCEACLFERITSTVRNPKLISKGDYEGSIVVLNKPLKGQIRRYKIYIPDPQTNKIRRVDFGSDNPSQSEKPRRFRTVHKCGDPSDPLTHWSCLE